MCVSHGPVGSRPLPEQPCVHQQHAASAPLPPLCAQVTEDGIFSCAGCGTALYDNRSRFNAGCGWPCFFTCLDRAVRERHDDDGSRMEIICNERHRGSYQSPNLPLERPWHERGKAWGAPIALSMIRFVLCRRATVTWDTSSEARAGNCRLPPSATA